ncbi:MAG: sigma 54-interacting transcriptional regulator [bacterium]
MAYWGGNQDMSMHWKVIEGNTQRTLDMGSEPLTIGRAQGNSLQVQDTLVSREHSRIEWRGEVLWVVDLGSSNGTRVNGSRVDRQQLKPGDEVAVGSVRLILEGQSASDTAAGLGTVIEDTHSQDGDLAVFARLTRELARETDLGPLLRQIVDSAIALVGSERGFLMLADKDQAVAQGDVAGSSDPTKWQVHVARNFNQEDIPVPRTRVSMGIMGKVIEEGRALLTVDAGQDERLINMASVEDLRLRSVLCVPIPGEARMRGLIYLDNRMQMGAFEARDLELAGLFAAQASVAIRTARLITRLREQNQRLEVSRKAIESLNEQLGRKVRDREGELAVARKELGRERGRHDHSAIIGSSDAMKKVFDQLERIMDSELPVLIVGESGTGKELIARAICRNSPRKKGSFVSENCAALPDSLLESELFGHVRGAFTGAYKNKRGLLEQAHGGTLFLDEVGDMSPEMQKKILRVLQEGEVRLVGSDKVLKVDVRILAASNRDLEAMVSEGSFREDLYYRLAVLRVGLPPLRERGDDIPLLAESLLGRASREAGLPAPGLPHEVLAALARHNWPGNVRELENEMRRLVVLAQGVACLDDLSSGILRSSGTPYLTGSSGSTQDAGDIKLAVADLERRSIESALTQAKGNKSQAARALGISRFALQRKLEKYGIPTQK